MQTGLRHPHALIVMALIGSVFVVGTCIQISKPPEQKQSINLDQPESRPAIQPQQAQPSEAELAAKAEKEWDRQAINKCEIDGMRRSRDIAESTGLDVEFPWFAQGAVMAGKDKDFAYIQFQREFKATIFGTRVKRTMLINYRCWGQPVQCEYLRHGID